MNGLFYYSKKNMKEIYEKVDYWSDTEKQAELKDNAARFIVVTNTTTSIPVAFVHFRFLIEMCNKLALYCYEIQLDSSVQRKGLGKHLMQLLEVIAKLHKYDWIILTVFKINTNAITFYKNLGFKIDEISPSACGESTAPYEILSVKII